MIREAVSHSSRGRLIGRRREMLKSTDVPTRHPFLVRSLSKLYASRTVAGYGTLLLPTHMPGV